MTGVVGVGVDVTEISRIRSAIEKRPRFVERIYTPAEAAYCTRMRNPWRRFATRFAGKEAVMKSLGLGARGVLWTDIEILGRGKPEVRLAGKVAERAAALAVGRIEISLTHGEDLAIAVAVAVSRFGGGGIGGEQPSPAPTPGHADAEPGAELRTPDWEGE